MTNQIYKETQSIYSKMVNTGWRALAVPRTQHSRDPQAGGKASFSRPPVDCQAHGACVIRMRKKSALFPPTKTSKDSLMTFGVEAVPRIGAHCVALRLRHS